MKKIFLILGAIIIISAFYFFYMVPTSDKSTLGVVDLKNSQEVSIDMINFTFEPSMIEIKKGTKVTWINKDSVAHSIKSDPHPEHDLYPDMNSEDMNEGEIFSFTFEKEGEYPYHCDPHARGMIGKIIVR